VARHFPQSSNNPANLILAYRTPIWQHPQSVHAAGDQLRSSGQFTSLAGPLNANGTTLTPARYAQLHAVLGVPRSLPPIEPAGIAVPRAAYNAYRASAEYVSADGEFEAGLTAGPQQTTKATNATPTIREVVAQAAANSGAVGNGVAGEAAASYDISTTSNHDLVVIVPIAIAAIGLLLALVLRSAVAPLYLIVSVALSYLAAPGIAVLAFVTIGGQNGLPFVLPFSRFIFLLALGEDYNILVNPDPRGGPPSAPQGRRGQGHR
jgi:putative drug exporter of the RND superfamily